MNIMTNFILSYITTSLERCIRTVTHSNAVRPHYAFPLSFNIIHLTAKQELRVGSISSACSFSYCSHISSSVVVVVIYFCLNERCK